jgi:choline dehydrogenase-like flavoprotein
MQQADYVVVGAGSAGAIVARRLAESGADVVVLEAGKADRTRFVRKPGLIAVFHNVPQLKKTLDWGFCTVPQQHALNRRIPQTRGKVLGGSSSINGMLFVRGNPRNFDDWAGEGAKGWGWDDVLPAYKKLENWEGGASDVRGAGGPVQVTRVKNLTDASTRFIEAMAATAGVPVLDDYNGHTQEGVGTFQQSAHQGLRYSSSVSYLDDPLPNLTVLTHTLATRVVVENGRATGVEVRDRSGTRVIRASREVVVSAGAYQSPQLLQLSGIGPADHLRDHGIAVHADLPVGDNLHDHMFVPVTFDMPSARNRSSARYFAKGVLQEYTRGNTWVGQTVFEVCGFVRSSLATTVPDIQIHALPWGYPYPNQDAPVRHHVEPQPALTVFSTLIYPRSRGTVRLASADPAAAPLIDPRFLAEPEDTQVLVEGIELIREAMGAPGIVGGVDKERSPGARYADAAALRTEIPNRATTVYHPVGSCRMGVDERAVVDPELKVRGIDGLRVADASIMPSVTGGNTNAPAMMIGERCAELMLAD